MLKSNLPLVGDRMLREVLLGLVCGVFFTPIYCSSQVGTGTWTKQSSLQTSYFNAPVPNVLRCGKLCEKQKKCIAVSFDVAKTICYLHETPVAAASTNGKGKYLVRNIRNTTKESDPAHSCNSAELSVPSARQNGESCVKLNEKHATKPTTTEEATTPTGSTELTTTPTESTELTTTPTEGTELTTTPTESIELTTTPTGSTELTTTPTGSTELTTTPTESTEPTTTPTGSTELTTTPIPTTVNPCKNNQLLDGNSCNCQAPLSGQYCENGPRDCSGVTGTTWTDVYPEDGIGKITVFCWDDLLIIFSVSKDGLPSDMQNKNWGDFKNGFGNIDNTGYTNGGGYWLGNDNIQRITNGALSYKLQYDGDFPAGNLVGHYSDFVLDSESNNYTLHFSSYSSSNGMEEMLQDNIPFRTVDWNDNGCAGSRQTGFWFGMTCKNADVLFGSVRIDTTVEQYDDFWGSLVLV